MGSLLIESFFGIPGLGSYMLTRSAPRILPSLRTMVFIGSILHIIGLILTDISIPGPTPGCG